MHGSMQRVRQKFSEMEMNQHFGKTLATHFHVINTTQDSHIHQTTSFTYTSNPYTSNHNLHIYIKPQDSDIHQTYIHQTIHTSFTYTSHHKLHKKRKRKQVIYG